MPGCRFSFVATFAPCAGLILACSSSDATSTSASAPPPDAAASAADASSSLDPDAAGSGDTAPSADAHADHDADADASTSPSGQPVPNGDLPGWKLVFTDDFLVDAPLGSFPGSAYGNTWSAYPDGWHDTSGNGMYSPERTLSVGAGVLVIDVHTENGVHYVAAPEPMKGAGQAYGRYSVRFRATQTTSDYKTAWLLWPDSDTWPADGEIDFPEGNLNGDIHAYAHYANPAGGQDAFENSNTPYTGWHTATIEWSPGNVTFLLDGKALGSSTTQVPSKRMHWVLQTETNLDGVVPSNSSTGRLEVDWVTIWSKQ